MSEEEILLEDTKVVEIALDGVELIRGRYQPDERKWKVVVEKELPPPIGIVKKETKVDGIKIGGNAPLTASLFPDKGGYAWIKTKPSLCAIVEREVEGRKVKIIVCAPKIIQKGRDIREILR